MSDYPHRKSTSKSRSKVRKDATTASRPEIKPYPCLDDLNDFPGFVEGLRNNNGVVQKQLRGEKVIPSGALNIDDVTLVQWADATTLNIELKWTTKPDNSKPKVYSHLYRAKIFGSDDPRDDGDKRLCSQWGVLADRGWFLPTNIPAILATFDACDHNGLRPFVLWCEGEKTRRAVAALVQRHVGVFHSAGYEPVTGAWLCGMPGAKDTNFALEPPDLQYVITGKNDRAINLAGAHHVIVRDNDKDGQNEAATVARRFEGEYHVAAVDVCIAQPPAGVVEGWDDADGLPQGTSEQQRIEMYLNARPASEDFHFITVKGRLVIDSEDDHNIRVALRKLGARCRLNEFSGKYEIEGYPGIGPIVDDSAVKRLWFAARKEFEFRPSKNLFFDTFEDEAFLNKFHPVRDYLNGLTWDGVPRLDDWLIKYAGAEDTPFNRAVGALLPTALVRRVRQPGCQFDEMVVLEGPQGVNKSSALAIMAGKKEWFTDNLRFSADGQETIEATAGKWIVEMAELNKMNKGEGAIETLKVFLSRRVDEGRLPYAHFPVSRPRQWVPIGTTNEGQYLKDTTGNRRIWPVKIVEFNLEMLDRDHDQLWAEAAAREATGCSIRLDKSLWEAAAAEQSEREEEDAWEEDLAAHFGDQQGWMWSTDVALVLKLTSAQKLGDYPRRIGAIMKKLGFARKQRRPTEKNKPQEVKDKPQGKKYWDPQWIYLRGIELKDVTSKNQILPPPNFIGMYYPNGSGSSQKPLDNGSGSSQKPSPPVDDDIPF